MNRSILFGLRSIAVGLAVGAFSALLIWLSSNEYDFPKSFWAVAEQVSMLSALVVVPAALGGLVFGVIGVVAALKLRSAPGCLLSAVGIILVIVVSYAYLVGWTYTGPFRRW